jgi:hypothetical protein
MLVSTRFLALLTSVIFAALLWTVPGCKKPSSDGPPACSCQPNDPLCSCPPGTAAPSASVGSTAPSRDDADSGTQGTMPAVTASTAPADEGAESICGNVETWSLVSALDCGLRPDDRRLALTCTDSLANVAMSVARTIDNDRLDASKKKQVLVVLADAVPAGQVKALSTVLATVQGHAARPGEEPIKQSLVADYQKVIGAYRAWSTVMRAYDGTDAKVNAQTDKTTAIIAAVEKRSSARLDQCRALRTGAPTSSATTLKTTAKKAATREVRVPCPSGLAAESYKFGCNCGEGKWDEKKGMVYPAHVDIPQGCSFYAGAEGSVCIFSCE